MKRTVIALGLAVGLAAAITVPAVIHRTKPILGAEAETSAPALPYQLPAPGASASASAGPSPSSLPPSRFDLPPLAKESIPETRSEMPTADEWKNAPAIEVTRRSRAARTFRVYRVREYIKVHTSDPTSGIRMHAGDRKDVAMTVVPRPDYDFRPPNGGDIVFPLRRNEPRLFQFFGIEFGYDGGASPVPSFIVDASWPDSAPGPTVVIR